MPAGPFDGQELVPDWASHTIAPRGPLTSSSRALALNLTTAPLHRPTTSTRAIARTTSHQPHLTFVPPALYRWHSILRREHAQAKYAKSSVTWISLGSARDILP